MSQGVSETLLGIHTNRRCKAVSYSYSLHVFLVDQPLHHMYHVPCMTFVIKVIVLMIVKLRTRKMLAHCRPFNSSCATLTKPLTF